METEKKTPSLKEYIKTKEIDNEWLTREVVKEAKDTRAVVLPQSGWKQVEYEEQGQKQTQEKPYIYVSLDGRAYEWTMAKSAARNLAKELGEEMSDWSGATIKLFEDGNRGFEFVNGLVISKGAAQ